MMKRFRIDPYVRGEELTAFSSRLSLPKDCVSNWYKRQRLKEKKQAEPAKGTHVSPQKKQNNENVFLFV